MKNQTLEELSARKSVRAYEDIEITPEDRSAIITAAAMAPTAGNQQLYTILDVTDPELKERLADLCDHQPFIARSKLLLVFCADCKKWYDAFVFAGCEPRRPGTGDFLLAVNDALIAAQNAVTAAESLGIGSCYIGDVMENCEQMREALRLPKYVFPAALLVFGYPTEQQKNRKKPGRIEEKYLVHENTYHPLSDQELSDMLSYKAGDKDYNTWIRAFCSRKYNSDFSKEMSRSVSVYLRDFLDDPQS